MLKVVLGILLIAVLGCTKADEPEENAVHRPPKGVKVTKLGIDYYGLIGKPVDHPKEGRVLLRILNLQVEFGLSEESISKEILKGGGIVERIFLNENRYRVLFPVIEKLEDLEKAKEKMKQIEGVLAVKFETFREKKPKPPPTPGYSH